MGSVLPTLPLHDRDCYNIRFVEHLLSAFFTLGDTSSFLFISSHHQSLQRAPSQQERGPAAHFLDHCCPFNIKPTTASCPRQLPLQCDLGLGLSGVLRVRKAMLFSSLPWRLPAISFMASPLSRKLPPSHHFSRPRRGVHRSPLCSLECCKLNSGSTLPQSFLPHLSQAHTN